MLGINRSEHTIYHYILTSVFILTPTFLYATDKLVEPLAINEVLKDPTLPKNYMLPADLSGAHPLQNGNNSTSLKLSAIFVGKNKRIAIINGRILREGDSFGKCKIKNIHESSVLVLLLGKDNSIEELVIKLPAKIIKGKE
jgi:hypothetical protein